MASLATRIAETRAIAAGFTYLRERPGRANQKVHPVSISTGEVGVTNTKVGRLGLPLWVVIVGVEEVWSGNEHKEAIREGRRAKLENPESDVSIEVRRWASVDLISRPKK